MGLGSYEAYKLTVYGTTIKRYKTARNRYKCGKYYTMKAYMGNGHKPPRILDLGIRERDVSFKFQQLYPSVKNTLLLLIFPCFIAMQLLIVSKFWAVHILKTLNHFHPKTKHVC
jgi:hypothetical protein